IADVPIYFADPLVRRAISLQMTPEARPPKARANTAELRRLGVSHGDKVRLSQPHGGEAELEIAVDDRLADGVLRVAAAHPTTSRLGPMFGPITVERI
ncbi:MAG TPA: NADH-quinone oxidoreductase subunit G, partial [Burkholderiaceae bacterium]|nr:NADH-quinone oxidoreductase subunit G [Burkholderiaceae bacterium]